MAVGNRTERLDPETAAMDSYRISSPVQRDTSVRRLRSMTASALVAGAAAAVTFGVVAAISNPGHQTTASTGGSTSGQSGQSGSAGDQSTVNDSQGTTSQSNSFFQAPAQQPGFFGGGGQTTTGGS